MPFASASVVSSRSARVTAPASQIGKAAGAGASTADNIGRISGVPNGERPKVSDLEDMSQRFVPFYQELEQGVSEVYEGQEDRLTGIERWTQRIERSLVTEQQRRIEMRGLRVGGRARPNKGVGRVGRAPTPPPSACLGRFRAASKDPRVFLSLIRRSPARRAPAPTRSALSSARPSARRFNLVESNLQAQTDSLVDMNRAQVHFRTLLQHSSRFLKLVLALATPPHPPSCRVHSSPCCAPTSPHVSRRGTRDSPSPSRRDEH